MSDNQLVPWNSPAVVEVQHTLDLRPVLSQVASLSPRDVQKVQEAFQHNLFDMATEFVWRRTVNTLRTQILQFGPEFVMEMLGRPVVPGVNISDLVTEVDVITLATELGFINRTAMLYFLHTHELLNHLASLRDDGEDINPFQAAATVSYCVQYVLKTDWKKVEFPFGNFRDQLKEIRLEADMDLVTGLMSAAYFYKRTTLRTLLNLVRVCQGGELENAFFNLQLLGTKLWKDLKADDKWRVGSTYAELVSDGKKRHASAFKSLLTTVRGFDYVPESLRSNTYIDAAKNLMNAHNGFDNFYNEVPAAEALCRLGSSIPGPAFASCMSAILACRLGNAYNVSWNAQPWLDQMLKALSRDQWDHYINEVLPTDTVVLFKLTLRNPYQQWCSLVKKYELGNLRTTDRRVRRLLECQGADTVKLNAEALINLQSGNQS